jgi:hypothetical protein
LSFLEATPFSQTPGPYGRAGRRSRRHHAHDGGRLLIAKFSSLRDEWDVIAWEKTALDLAERACITVPGRRLERIAGRSVLLLDRFDRTPDGARIPYLSAMSLSTTRMTTYATTGFLGLMVAGRHHQCSTSTRIPTSASDESLPLGWESTQLMRSLLSVRSHLPSA